MAWTVVACLALGLGGLVLDHFFGGPVGKSAPLPTGTDPPSLNTSAPSSGSVPPGLSASVGAMMLLKGAGPGKASEFSLTSLSDRPLSLSSFRGKVVVLSFFDSRCDDICPVLERELTDAMAALSKKGEADQVEFVTVNTDPLATSLSSTAPAERPMVGTKDWQYLTGSLQALDSVWKSYGITVEAQASTDTVSHTDAMYFIDKTGSLRAEATPFADQIRKGKFTLPVSTIEKFASGIASESEYLLTGAHT